VSDEDIITDGYLGRFNRGIIRTPPLTYACHTNCRVVTFSSVFLPAYCPSCTVQGVEI
jgi:hypothetical protein